MPAYQSILDKVGIFVSANVNSLLDRALSLNSVAVFDEYVNRMNGSLDALVMAEGVERGRVKTLARQIGELEAECANLDGEVDRLLEKNERGLAATRQGLLNTKRRLLEDLKENLAQAQGEVQKLADARARLETQIEVTKAKREELVVLLEQKRAAELRYKAQAGVHMVTPGTTRTEEMLERARQEAELAEGRVEAAATATDARIAALLESDEIEAQLAEREARLKKA
ncbi:MAG: hypothetical protein M1136_03640 [Chloroflexi bacterium]|nr:hypothetical protein [Chloroflexota bacterium]MCL5074733.1 hypothetical protein [Chloroflexota bacterium]